MEQGAVANHELHTWASFRHHHGLAGLVVDAQASYDQDIGRFPV